MKTFIFLHFLRVVCGDTELQKQKDDLCLPYFFPMIFRIRLLEYWTIVFTVDLFISRDKTDIIAHSTWIGQRIW